MGLLHPVVVTPTRELIAGERRLVAVQRLGWANVPVTIVDLVDVVRGEAAENILRADLTLSEKDAILGALRPIEAAAAKARQREHGGTAPGRQSRKVTGTVDTRDKLGAYVGLSGRTVEKLDYVMRPKPIRKPRPEAPMTRRQVERPAPLRKARPIPSWSRHALSFLPLSM